MEVIGGVGGENNQAFVLHQPRGSQIHLASALRVVGRGASGERQNAVAPADQSGRKLNSFVELGERWKCEWGSTFL